MSKVLMGLLGAAVVLALGLGPLVTTAHARHIEAGAIRGAAEAVADAATTAEPGEVAGAVEEAVKNLVGLVSGPPEDVPGEGHAPDEGETIDVQNLSGNVPNPSEDADGVGLDVAAAAATADPDEVADAVAAAVEELKGLLGVVAGPPEGVPSDDEDDE